MTAPELLQVVTTLLQFREKLFLPTIAQISRLRNALNKLCIVFQQPSIKVVPFSYPILMLGHPSE